MSPPALPALNCAGCAKAPGFSSGRGIQTRGDKVMTLRATCLSAFAAAILMATVPTGAQATVEVGGLSCRSAGTVGYVVGAVLNFECVFVPSAGGPAHR